MVRTRGWSVPSVNVLGQVKVELCSTVRGKRTSDLLNVSVKGKGMGKDTGRAREGRGREGVAGGPGPDTVEEGRVLSEEGRNERYRLRILKSPSSPVG